MKTDKTTGLQQNRLRLGAGQQCLSMVWGSEQGSGVSATQDLLSGSSDRAGTQEMLVESRVNETTCERLF